ncbi:DNA polymerase III subunit gamma/tau [Agromyces sp. NPDC058110]|uniref:DNA polymerase III subunit gamma/tau n=1 Tax=Agromyces sp. NPDC058110 TaxID=3346345 RepID=UPI0036DDE76E
MTRETDDDALRWEGDDDPTLAPGWKKVGPAVTASTAATASDANGASGANGAAAASDPAGTGARDRGAPGDATLDEASEPAGDATAAPQTGSVELVVLGILAGVYLLYTIGWFITALRTSVPGVSVVSDAMYGLGLWLAVLAAPCWFALALRAGGRRARLAWLIAGALVLAPLPFVLGVTA